jgi:hypothetical protein
LNGIDPPRGSARLTAAQSKTFFSFFNFGATPFFF